MDNSFKSKGTGRDEINLIDMPLSVFGKNLTDVEDNDDLIRINVFNKNSGKALKGEVRIYGLGDGGRLLHPGDEDLVMLLSELTSKRGFDAGPEIEFPSLNYLITKLGWSRTGASYARIWESFIRLRALTIETNVFYDKKSNTYGDQIFGLLSSVYVGKKQVHNMESPDKDISSAIVRIVWDPILYASFQAGNYKYLNMDLYWKVKTPGTRKLYRILDKRFYMKSKVKMPLKYLAGTLLNLEESHGPWYLKRQISKYAEELIKAEYLRGYEFIQEGSLLEVVFTKVLIPKAEMDKLLSLNQEEKGE